MATGSLSYGDSVRSSFPGGSSQCKAKDRTESLLRERGRARETAGEREKARERARERERERERIPGHEVDGDRVVVVRRLGAEQLPGGLPLLDVHVPVKRFRGGLVFKAHRLLYHAAQDSRTF